MASNSCGFSISYVDGTMGIKLHKTVSVGSSVTEYAGSYVYQNGTFQFFNHPERYMCPNGLAVMTMCASIRTM